MKELLTEWRKFINEYEDDYDREQFYRNAIAKPDAKLDGIIHEVLTQAETIHNFLYPDVPEELEHLGEGEEFVKPAMRNILDYTSIWFENHEVKEEDKEKANALKTFVDWLNRNLEEMLKITNLGDYEKVMDSKPHKILKVIAGDLTYPNREKALGMLMSLGPQLDKF